MKDKKLLDVTVKEAACIAVGVVVVRFSMNVTSGVIVNLVERTDFYKKLKARERARKRVNYRGYNETTTERKHSDD